MSSIAYRKKSQSSPARLHSLIFGLMLLLAAETVGAQIRTVLVSPVPGDPIASGTALRNALTGISSPSSTNRWLLKIEPGIYDIGTASLGMLSWVDIEGSGIGITTIRGSALPATINGASNAELRLLTVEAKPNSEGAFAMENLSASPRIYRVRFSVTGGNGGVRNVSSTPLIEECEIAVTALSSMLTASGVSFRGIPPAVGRSSILRSRIRVSGAQANHGVLMRDSQFLSEIRDSQIEVSGGQTTHGVYAFVELPWSGHESLIIRNTEIISAGGSVASYGINIEAPALIYLDISGSRIWGHASLTTYGIKQSGPAAAGVQWSYIFGSTQTIQTAGSISIQSTFLSGGPAAAQGWLGCMGVWDENGVFYANSCP